MNDDQRRNDDEPGEKSQKKDQYNPVNMAGRKAGILKELEEQTAKESAGDDDASKSEDKTSKK